MTYLRTLALLGFVVTLSNMVHGQTETCRLIESWLHRNPSQASSNSLVGEFPLVRADSPTAKVFRHDETGLDISVGVEIFKGMFKYEPTRIRVAILAGASAADVFDVDTNASQAVSTYDSNWRFLSVNRSIARNDRIYTFTFSCERSPRKRVH